MTTPAKGGPVEQLIRRARKRITDPTHWCQNAMAVDRAGFPISNPHNKKAVRWCHNGALCKAGYPFGNQFRSRLSSGGAARLAACYRLVFSSRPRRRKVAHHEIKINNFHNQAMAHAAVLCMMDRAAAIAAEKGW